ncbi:MAG: ankyrin repeat domain-containing protein [Burkholderiales bacterium]|nr:ankyrin repeat domain-containing protein [Burkholderiales bacterium]
MRSVVAAGLAAVAVTLSGCGTMQHADGDAVRMVNAIVMDDAGYVRAAVESKAVTVNQRVPAPAYMEGTPLITIAARAAALDVLRYLVAAGADVNARTPADETPLMLAAFFGDDDGAASPRHEAAVRLLVKAGASLETETHNYTPLTYAAYKNRQHTLRFLLQLGANVDGGADESITYVNTPLMMAAIQGYADTVRLLLEAGANPRIRMKGGHTASELALKHRHERLARLLHCAETLPPGARLAERCP